MTIVGMTDRVQTASPRARIGAGVAFLASAMVAAAVLAGIGFAGNAPSASQYQYGKNVAICHHTGSKTHPWVTLRIDLHAWPGHLKHGDTLGACSGKSPQGQGQNQDGKVTICHYAASKTPPWVTLRVDRHAWPAHLQHGDHLGPCGDSLPPTPVHHGKPMPRHGHGSGGGHGRNK
jgi:hypothetical protein